MISMQYSKPEIRVLHNMARSGGTLVGKCLGCMDHIILFSEIHPRIISDLDIIEQALHWFGLFTHDDLLKLASQKYIGFSAAVDWVRKRCEDRGKIMVIRDWSHIDFTAVPNEDVPSYKLMTSEYLSMNFNVIHTALVRHPIDQWLSLMQLQCMQGDVIDIDRYLQGYLRFAEKAIRVGFVRYEDITINPDRYLKQLCRNLEIRFDPTYKDRWFSYKEITGDIYGAGRGQKRIELNTRRAINRELKEKFEGDRNYQKAVALLEFPPY